MNSGLTSPDSPSTPTHGSNSLSISDGRDFLIDDEIADQPQLCFSEKFMERSCKDDVNYKSLESGSEFISFREVKKFTANHAEVPVVSENGTLAFFIPDIKLQKTSVR